MVVVGWGDQLSSEDRLVARYLAVSTSENTWFAQWVHESKGITTAWYTHNVTLSGIEAHASCIAPRSKADRCCYSNTWSASEHITWETRRPFASSRTCEPTTLSSLFIWRRNNRGRRTATWGTPEPTVAELDCLSSTTTCSTMFFKNVAVH